MTDSRVLVIDDEPAIVSGCKMILAEQGYQVESETSGERGLEKLLNAPFDLVLLDIQLPNITGIDILKIITKEGLDIAVVIMTGYGTVSNAVEAMKSGAFDFITKPFSEERLLCTVAKALQSIKIVKENLSLKKQLYDRFDYSNIIGETQEIKKVFERIDRVSPMDSTVLLDGESGTGKELFAKAIHVRSARASSRFLAVDCSTFASSVMESELFGHAKGAFTGAESSYEGIFGAAGDGTLFLDEVANLDLDIQGKLLRVLETGEYKPVGSNRILKSRARVVAATNRDLAQMIKDETFREDLFYRLNVFPIKIPPLRDRRDDIPKIAYHFLRLFCRKAHKKIHGFSDDALGALVNFDWPGNVRQLKNVVERLVIMCDKDQLDHRVLMDNLEIKPLTLVHSIPMNLNELKLAKKKFLEDNFSPIERSFLLNALKNAKGNITQAAAAVGMQRSNFSTMMKKNDIQA
ncbi:MAG: sigma-54 dependent transcriptional regulator [Desulfobacterium sp.]|jgi:DNA-binding NtrC family response regulator|nr:sigma-54 dependent transcriptional regulator [Desulfobacterium sp.]